jgi:integrase
MEGRPVEKLAPVKKLGKLDRRTGERISRDHHAAMPYRDVPASAAKLREVDTVAARALEFIFLNACRLSEAVDMPWSEVDLGKATWTVPGGRMKQGKEHLVPLSGRSVEILREMEGWRIETRSGPHPYVFPGQRPRKPLSSRGLNKLLHRFGGAGCTIHRARASFRTWCSESGVDFETAEMCLSHQLSNAVTQAYLRTTNLECRRIVMANWARFVNGEDTAEIPPLNLALRS